MDQLSSAHGTAMHPDAGRTGLRRMSLGLALAASAVIASVPTAATAAPQIPGGETLRIRFEGASRVCSFPVELAITDGTKVHKGAGVIFSTGPVTVTVTNLDKTDAARTYNISGPTFDDRTLTGPALILQPADAGLGDPFMIINKGLVTFNAAGSIESIRGTQTDICAALG